MAVAFDARTTGGNGANDTHCEEVSAATSLSSVNHLTAGASATLIVVTLVWQNNSSTDITGRSCTWAGTAMTERATNLLSSGSTRLRGSIFCLASASLTTGARTIAASWTGSSDCYLSASSFTGTDTTTGINTSDTLQSSGSTSFAVTSDANGASLALYAADGSLVTVDTQNILYANAPLNPSGAGSYGIAGTSNTHTFTHTGSSGTIRVNLGIHIIAPSAGAPEPTVNDAVTVAEAVTMKMDLKNTAANDSVTVADVPTMHMPIALKMEKLS